MSPDDTEEQAEQQLRAAAKAKLAQRLPGPSPDISDARRLLLELQLHQVELEMQNEALRQAQHALEESRDRYVDLYEFAPVGYVTVTADGLISQINLTGATLLGTERKHLLSRHFGSFVAETDRERYQCELGYALRHDSRRVIELTLQRRDGTHRDVLLDSRRMLSGKEAPLLHITLSDITERQQAERALRESERVKHDILDSVAASIAVLDNHGIIIAVNECWRRFALENSSEPGMSAHHTGLGVNYLEICLAASGDSSEGAREAHDGIRAVRDGRFPRFSLVYPCHSPSRKRWFVLSAIRLDGRSPGVVVAHSDVTELQEKELALTALRAELQEVLRWMVARHTVVAIAHEVNQPLTTISALCEAATRLLGSAVAAAPEQLEQILRLIAAASEDAGGKLRRLHESLRMPAAAPEAVALPDFLRETAHLARRGSTSPCKVLIHCPDDLPLVQINRLQLEKVLLNLLNNSFEAMREAPRLTGQVAIIAGLDAAAGGVRVTVRDNGPGIGREIERQLFHPFVSSKRGGLGLGLTISRALIEAQGGKLWGEPCRDAGATFHLTLPLAQTP